MTEQPEQTSGCFLCGKPIEDYTAEFKGMHYTCFLDQDEIPDAKRIAQLINEESDRIGGWKHALGKLLDPVADRRAAQSEPVQERERWGPITREASRLAAEAWHGVQKRVGRSHCISCRTLMVRPMSHH